MEEHALAKFLQAYGGIEPPQNPVQASTDGQIKSLATFLAVQLSSPPGVIIDVGAGRGALLARLVTIDDFLTHDWRYIAVEDQTHHMEILQQGLNAGIHKRLDLVPIKDFYASWPSTSDGVKQIIVVRNVLHELSVTATAELLAHVARNLPVGGLLVIQDLGVFPVAEKGNACWDSAILANLLNTLGFSITTIEEPTRSGNLWFNIIGSRIEELAPSDERILEMVVEARVRQWHSWAGSGALTRVDIGRDERLAKIDFDLQFAALTQQLYQAGGHGVRKLTRRQEQLAAFEIFERALQKTKFEGVYDSSDIPPVRHFKDRANSQTQLQGFLAGEEAAALICGPALMGKSVLVQHVLSTFGHRKKLVYIDALASWSCWNLLESILTGCGVRIPTEIIGRLQHMTLDSIIEPVKQFVSMAAPGIVLVVDHFERLLRPDDRVSPELDRIFGLWATVPGAKVIITSRRRVSATVLNGVLIDIDHPPVGRFPEGPHVENLLSFFIPLNEFPPALIEAIDRHPFLAELAGRIIEKEGESSITDATLLLQLQNRLRNKLMERVSTDLAVTGAASA
ncbi:hypothetical protein [Thiococcus pfennigii]|uniref:hypothetical protein n=1 Tax=Thiococcus pfennigii TaxID=1057 RepID=UPI00190440ED|nr:hypothetical protein [Thiococcus pfennigii]